MIALAAVLSLGLLAAPSVPLFDAPLDSLSRGQRGVCYTIFEGDQIEPFEFEIKGVMHDYLGPQRDVVLVRLLGDKPNFTGVVAGMSGSPCWVDGKLLGALAYAFAAFAKEPIAGITPIGSMLDVLALPEVRPPARLLAAAHDEAEWAAIRTALPPAPPPPDDDLRARPIATPLMLGGVPPAVRRHYEPWLRSLGFMPLAAGQAAAASATGTAVPGRLRPGGAIAAVLIQGDVDIAATGTVTYVDGDRVLGFGHPFLGTGAVSFPMADALILNTMVSAQRSFKMSVTGPPLGEITQDRLTAIAGRMGPVPRMLSVRGRVRAAGSDSRFHFEVARDLGMTPRLVAMGMASALGSRLEVSDRGTVRMTGSLEVAGLGRIPWRSVYAEVNDSSLLVSPGIDLARQLSVLWNAPFGPPPDIQIELDMEHAPEPVVERIEALSVDRPRVRVGQQLHLAVRLRRLDGPVAVAHFTVEVPQAWAGQRLTWYASNNEAADRLVQDTYGQPQPQSRADLVRLLRQRRGDGYIYLLATRAGASLQMGAQIWAFLPGSVAASLAGAPGQRRQGELGLAWEASQARPGTVDGQAQVHVDVLPK